MSKNNQAKATILLLIVSACFFISYPFHSNFWGGLIASMCSAAMIGGLADWFAVTALFRKPLGLASSRFIPTEIIPRNRERILHSLVDMVENELLTKATLKQRLAQYDFAKLLITHLTEQGGTQKLKLILNTLAPDLIAKIDPQQTGYRLDTWLRDELTKTELTPLLAEALDGTIRAGFDEKLITLILDEFMHLVDYQQLQAWLTMGLKQAKLRYEKGLKRREWAVNLLLSNLTEKPSPELRIELRKLLNSLLTSLQVYLRASIQELSENLHQDVQLSSKIEAFKTKILLRNTDLRQSLVEIIQVWQTAATQPAYLASQSALLDKLVDRLLADLEHNEAQQQLLNQILHSYLEQLIETNHHQIGEIVKTRLNTFTDELLVSFIETKAGNDLQMIRINGTAVGGLTGILLYLLTIWLP